MICIRCLSRASRSRSQLNPLVRTITNTSSSSAQAAASPRSSGPPSATSTSAAQPFSTPLSPGPNPVSLGVAQRPSKSKVSTVVSSVPAGAVLKGLNYIKGRDDPVALADEEYPEWLWTLLDEKKGEEGVEAEGDEFSKSKKLRRAAAKRARKLEAQLIESGNTEALQPKIPLQRQTIDLPSNAEGTLQGALKAAETREDLRQAMRGERRKNIKEANYLKGMK